MVLLNVQSVLIIAFLRQRDILTPLVSLEWLVVLVCATESYISITYTKA